MATVLVGAYPGIRLIRWLLTGLLLACAQAAMAQCAQITTWSNSDTSYFPVTRVSRIDRNNTPGPYYFDIDSVQEKKLLVTYFAMTASPSLTRDQLFGNAFSVSISSFASNADAKAMFDHEVAAFDRINPFRWGYSILFKALGLLSYYGDEPGNKDIYSIVLYGHTIIRVNLQSSSQTESVQSVGSNELAVRLQQARNLVDFKCGTRPANSAPTVALAPQRALDESFQAAFQREMVIDKVGGKITIEVTDPDGMEDIDWGSFKVFVAGIDKTAHVLQVFGRLAAEGRVVVTPTLTSARYELRPAPERLMGDHNLFNIQWNGQWPIQLKVCDRKGLCAAQSYDLYFGPFLEFTFFDDLRCLVPDYKEGLRARVEWGNNGYTALADFYVLLGRPNSSWEGWTSEFYSLVLGPAQNDGLLWLDWTNGRRGVFGAVPVLLQTGAYQPDTLITMPTVALSSDRRATPIPPGQRTLAFGAVDIASGAHRIESWQEMICQGR